jgi:hypothetical protein
MSAGRLENLQLEPFFEATTKEEESPSSKYKTFRSLIYSNGMASLPRIFLSTTLTSGGYKKIESDLGVAMEKNIQLSLTFREMLLTSGRVSTEEHLLIFPPNLGKVPGWTQLDYNFFWLDIITGLKPEDAEKLETELRPQINEKEYNNHALSSEIRKHSYLKFIQGFYRLIKENQFEIDPVSMLIQLVDPKSSLGCYVEELLARSLNIPVSQVVINNIALFPKHEELSNLIRLGVDIPAARLSINPDDPLLLVTQLPLI